MKIAVVGASGFIGARTTRRFAQMRDTNVVALSRMPPTLLPHQVEHRYVSFEVPAESLRCQLSDIDCIVYAAGNAVPRAFEANPQSAFAAETTFVTTLLESLPNSRPIRCVFLSSGGTVYGESGACAHSEVQAASPVSIYGATKLACEALMLAYAARERVDPVILRLSNCFGPGQHPKRGQGVVATFGAALLANEPLEIWGAGQEVRDFVYVDDAVDAIARAVVYRGEERIFNIGSGVGVSLLQLIDSLSKQTSSISELRFHSAPKGAVAANVLDISRARKLLRWTPKTTLHDGLGHTLEWLRNIQKEHDVK